MKQVKGRILAHRGLSVDGSFPCGTWTEISSALEQGFGLEVDLRDHLGQIVLSHDPVIDSETIPKFSDLADLTASGSVESGQILALNVKSSELAPLVFNLTEGSFFFDMSVPDALKYRTANLNFAWRLSELESLLGSLPFTPKFWWIDAFHTEWYLDTDVFGRIMDLPGIKTFVSPELHKRESASAWKLLSRAMEDSPDVAICTDHPEDFWGMLNGH